MSLEQISCNNHEVILFSGSIAQLTAAQTLNRALSVDSDFIRREVPVIGRPTQMQV